MGFESAKKVQWVQDVRRRQTESKGESEAYDDDGKERYVDQFYTSSIF